MRFALQKNLCDTRHDILHNRAAFHEISKNEETLKIMLQLKKFI